MAGVRAVPAVRKGPGPSLPLQAACPQHSCRGASGPGLEAGQAGTQRGRTQPTSQPPRGRRRAWFVAVIYVAPTRSCGRGSGQSVRVDWALRGRGRHRAVQPHRAASRAPPRAGTCVSQPLPGMGALSLAPAAGPASPAGSLSVCAWSLARRPAAGWRPGERSCGLRPTLLSQGTESGGTLSQGPGLASPT